MELNFVQSSEVFGKNTLAWETEFKIKGNFNLHIERKKGGEILVYQRTSGSGYAIVEEFRGMDKKPAIDLEFTSVVYPKFVKIVSESQPTYATVTTDGEITEIKSQSKEVEVTANGTMDITPDAGFSYLNSVKVKTNVPTSGEGGGSASSWRYYDVSNSSDKNATRALYPVLAKYLGNIVFSQMVEDWSSVSAFGVDVGAKIKMGDNVLTWAEAMALEGLTPEVMAQVGISEISEEEFYNLA